MNTARKQRSAGRDMLHATTVRLQGDAMRLRLRLHHRGAFARDTGTSTSHTHIPPPVHALFTPWPCPVLGSSRSLPHPVLHEVTPPPAPHPCIVPSLTVGGPTRFSPRGPEAGSHCSAASRKPTDLRYGSSVARMCSKRACGGGGEEGGGAYF